MLFSATSIASRKKIDVNEFEIRSDESSVDDVETGATSERCYSNEISRSSIGAERRGSFSPARSRRGGGGGRVCGIGWRSGRRCRILNGR